MMPVNTFFHPLSISQKILRDEIAPSLPELLEDITEAHPSIESIRESLLKIEYQHEFLAIKMILAVLWNKNNVTKKDIIQFESILKQGDVYLQKEKKRPFDNESRLLLENRLRFWPTFLIAVISALALLIFYKDEAHDFSKKTPRAKLFIALIPVFLGAGSLLSVIFMVSVLKCFDVFPRHKKPGMYVPLEYDSLERDNSRIIDCVRYYYQNKITAPECPFTQDTLEKINDFSSEFENFSFEIEGAYTLNLP